MKRWVSAVAAWVLVASGLLWLASTPATAEVPTQTGAERFAACLNASRSGDLLILMDESGSLRVPSDGLPASDPEDVRVAATQLLVERLATSAEQSGLDLSISLASFGTRYDAMGDRWTPMSSATLPEIQHKVESFRDKDHAQGTDYWLGLDGARSALVARQAGQDRCQAIVFFSDGALDIQQGPEDDRQLVPRPYAPQNRLATPQERNEATQAAAESLCRPGGLADQIRTSGIVVLGVGLAVERPDATFDLMRGIATGQRGTEPCGEQTTPVPGEFTRADSIDDMIFALTEVLGAGQVQEAPVCQGAVCAEGAHSFVLDASVSRADVMGTADVDGATVLLTAPDGSRFELGRDALTATPVGISGVTGTFRWLSDRTVQMTLHAEGSSLWAGQWQVGFVDPASRSEGRRSRTSITVRGDLAPQWVPTTDPVRVDAPLTGVLQLTNGRGERVDAAGILGTMSLTAAWVDPQGAETALATDLPKERLGEQVTVQPTLEGTHLVRLTLQVTTAPATAADGSQVPGTPLAPVAVDIPVSVLAPLGYPDVGARVDFGHIVGNVEATSTLAVQGPGCVWVEPGSTQVDAAPASVTGVTVASPASSRESCVRLENGASGTLPLRLSANEGGNGGLNGTVTVSLAPLDESGATRPVQVSFGADLSKPLNQGRFWLTLLTALLLGTLLPIGLLYLYKLLFASKIPAKSLQPLIIPLTIENGRVLRDGAPLALIREDERVLARIPAGGTRALTVGPYLLRTKLGASPLGPGHVVVETHDGSVGATDVVRLPQGKQRRAMLPLDVHNHWAVLVQPGDASRATLLLLLSGSAGPEQRDSLVASAAMHLPDLVTTLAGGPAGAGTAPARFDDDPFAHRDRPAGPDPFDFGSTETTPDDDDPFARR